MPLKRSDFEGGQFSNSYEVGSEKVKFNEFTFDKNNLSSNPILLVMAILAIDPSPKQEEFMKKLGIVFTDDNKKQVFPKIAKGDKNVDKKG